MNRLRLAIVGLTACSGCQLALLNCEAELPLLLEGVRFDLFPLACSPVQMADHYDVALVEGCCTTTHEAELLEELRRRSRLLIALGTCALWGGVAAMCNHIPRTQLRSRVYGAHPPLEDGLPQPITAHVTVDAGLTGCPPEKHELLALLGDLLRGNLPPANVNPVCNDCRMQENLCLLQERNQLCLGPLTLGGCEARCPSRGVPCEGCRGPAPEANLAEALVVYQHKGFDEQTITARLRRFCPEWNHEQRA